MLEILAPNVNRSIQSVQVCNKINEKINFNKRAKENNC